MLAGKLFHTRKPAMAKLCVPSTVVGSWNNETYMIYELDLTILQLYLHTTSELSRSWISKVAASRTDKSDRMPYDAAFAGGKNGQSSCLCAMCTAGIVSKWK